MTISEIATKLSAEAIVATETSCNGVYVGDFLSRVMGRAPSGCVWLTIMTNVNVAGVAVLAEIGAIVLCEGEEPDERLTERCRAENVALLRTGMTVYDACVALSR